MISPPEFLQTEVVVEVKVIGRLEVDFALISNGEVPRNLVGPISGLKT